MSTTIADVIARATGMSVSNNTTDLSGNASEMIAAVAAWERDIFRAAAALSRFFGASQTVTSTSGSANRTLNLAGLVPPVERVVAVNSPTAVVHRVDFEDVAAELPPRFYAFATSLYEVGSEWSATAGTVDLSVWYAMAPTPLDPTGNTGQTLTLPDEYTDLIVLRLAHYLAVKDTGRDPLEAQSLQSSYDKRMADVIERLDHFAGPARRRFLSPERLPGGSE